MKRLVFLAVAVVLFVCTSLSQAALIDRGKGLIYDTDINVTWLQDANYARTSGYNADGKMDYYEALAWVSQLNYEGYTGWRLPSCNPYPSGFPYDGTGGEMAHLYYDELKNWNYDGSNTGPFLNVEKGISSYPLPSTYLDGRYWANYVIGTAGCHFGWTEAVNIYPNHFEGQGTSGMTWGNLTDRFIVWPVRNGDVGQQCASVTSGLLGWWTGEWNAGDIVNGNDGTAVGNVGSATGVVGQAFSLEGLNSYVNAGNPPMLQVSNGDFTIDAWVLFNALSNPREVTIAPLGDMSIVDKMSAQYVNVDGWRLLKQDDNRFWFCLGGKDGNHCGDPAFTVFSTTTATTGVWYHVAAVKKANGLEIYVNGALQDSRTPLPDFLDTNAADLLIGASIAEGAPLNGLVDEVEVFNRALTADEIRAIYVAGSAGKCRELAVAIDIKPGTFPNAVKPLVKGTMPVAVLTTPEFNATRVDPATITFGVTGTETAPVRHSIQDVDGDGDLDMLLQFTTAETGIACGTTEAKLSGYNISGLAIVGKDSVTTVGCR